MPNPNSLPWMHYQDLQIPDISLQQQFYSYILNGNFNQALLLLNNNEQQLLGKAYIAKTINIISNALFQLEDYYYQGVLVFLSEKANLWYNLINNLNQTGNWNNQTQYQINNFTVYNNEIYFAIENPPIGTLPTDSRYWLYLGLIGEDGAPGLPGLNIRYDWISSIQYSVNDIVAYNNDLYIALQNNINIIPGSNDNIWELFVKVEQSGIFVGTQFTGNPINNTIWFKTEVDPLSSTTNNPVYGEFYCYNDQIGNWEEMYPDILFREIVGQSSYSESLINKQLIINPTDWIQGQFTYNIANLNSFNYIYVYPNFPINGLEYEYYNFLNIQIQESQIIFTIDQNLINNIPSLPLILYMQ